jgi:hypothetical protein
VRRLALTVVAAGLVVGAEGSATLSPAAPVPKPYGGEPQPYQNSLAPRAPWIAAVRFVRDYAAWEAGRLARLPSHDATERVIELLKHAGRHRLAATRGITRSVRMTASGARQYMVISVVGNFLIGRQGSRWMAVSVPGD